MTEKIRWWSAQTSWNFFEGRSFDLYCYGMLVGTRFKSRRAAAGAAALINTPEKARDASRKWSEGAKRLVTLTLEGELRTLHETPYR